MAVEGLGNFALLDAHCLPNMKPELKRTLILRACGTSFAAIAAEERVSEGTIKARLSTARAEIGLALPTMETLTESLCGYFVANHLSDCLKDAATELGLLP